MYDLVRGTLKSMADRLQVLRIVYEKVRVFLRDEQGGFAGSRIRGFNRSTVRRLASKRIVSVQPRSSPDQTRTTFLLKVANRVSRRTQDIINDAFARFTG